MENNENNNPFICPKCGAKAEGFMVYKIKKMTKEGEKVYHMIYLKHYSEEDKTNHKWYYAPYNEQTVEELRKMGLYAFNGKIVLNKNDLEKIRRYFISKRNYSVEDREFSKKILNTILSGNKIVVYLYR